MLDRAVWPARISKTLNRIGCWYLAAFVSLGLSGTAYADSWVGTFTSKSGILWTYGVQTDGRNVKVIVRGDRDGTKFEGLCADAALDAKQEFEVSCSYSGSPLKFKIRARLIGDTSQASYVADNGDRTSVQLKREKTPPLKNSPATNPPDTAGHGDAALDAIVANPEVKKKMGEFKSRLAWIKTDVEPGLDCYDLKENLPTHMPFVGTYCRDRASGNIRRYDPLTQTFTELRPLATARQEFDMVGPGTLTCADFLSDIAQDKNREQAYFLWAQGFMSGSNSELRLASKPRYNLNSEEFPAAAQKSLLRKICSEKPSLRFLFAVGGLFRNLPAMSGN